MGQRGKLFAFSLFVAMLGSMLASAAVTGASAGATVAGHRRAQTVADQWVDSWGASFLSTTVNGAVSAVPSFNNQTYRLNVFSKLGGTQVRVQLSNKFATNTLPAGAAHFALQGTNNSIRVGTDRGLTFGGNPGVTLAPGAVVWSDPVTVTLAQHTKVSVSVYVPTSFKPTTFHPTGLHTSYLSRPGNFTASMTLPLATFSNTTTQVLMVSDIQVRAPSSSEVAVAFGDSITDGACATNNANGTWPDVLSARLPALPLGSPFSVVNMGIGSNLSLIHI